MCVDGEVLEVPPHKGQGARGKGRAAQTLGAYFSPDVLETDREYRLMGDALAKFKHEALGGPVAMDDLRHQLQTQTSVKSMQQKLQRLEADNTKLKRKLEVDTAAHRRNKGKGGGGGGGGGGKGGGGGDGGGGDGGGGVPSKKMQINAWRQAGKCFTCGGDHTKLDCDNSGPGLQG